MEQQILQELESAARVILAPPSMISNQQRSEAEAVFLNFRRTKCPYQICKFIFENSSTDYVIFETSNTIKEAIIREWNQMEEDDINSIRNYLFQHILNKSNVAVFVREKILQVIAIIVKRGSVIDMGVERRKLLAEVEQLLISGELRKQILACSIICALMQEYSNTVKSADVGLSWETHLNTKKQFELTDLKKIFQLCVSTLSEICKISGNFSENVLTLLKSLLQIAEGTLMWAFISATMPKRIICIFELSHESDFGLSVKLGPHWKDVILAPSLVQLFFLLHWRIRNNAHLTHYTLNCLVQLASLNGPIFNNKSLKIDYVKNYIECFLSFLNSVEIVDRESIGISNIFIKLLIFNETIITSELAGEEIVCNFFQQMTRLTCHFAEKASQQDSTNFDESMFTEAFDNMLKAWNCSFRMYSESAFHQASKCIFDSYLQWHLSPPCGSRTKLSCDEIDETEEEEDLNKFGFQLQAIGIFGRQVTSHALPTLARLIDEKTHELRSMCQGVSAANTNATTATSNSQRDDLYEDLHWLLMIAGHVLTQEKYQLAAKIPSSIIKYSMERANSININDSLALLASVDRLIAPSDYARLEETTDHVIWLVSSVFRLSELEKYMGEAELCHFLSPTLSSTISWFLQTWSHSYLLLQECSYTEISLSLASAFGKQTDCAKWIVDFILNKVQSNFRFFGADHRVTENTCKLLLSLVSSRDKALFLLKNPNFWNIIDNGLRNNNNRYVSPEVKKMLIKSFTIAVSAYNGPDQRRKEYVTQVVKPLIDKFRSVIMEENFKKQYHDEMVRSEIMEIIHLFLGMVGGAGVIEGTGVAVCKCLYEYLSPALSDMVSLIELYHNYQQIIQLVLELFRECSHTLLCFLSKGDAQSFYECCLRLVEVYVKHNCGRLTEEVNAEEDSLQDLLLFLDLLTNLSNKDIIDLSSTEENGNNGGRDESTCVNSVAVTMLGLRGILPLMSVEILKFPALCSKFYSLLSFMSQLHSEYICDQPQDFLVSILAVIELGLTLFGTEITTLCCEFVQAFSKYLCLNASYLKPEKFLLLQPFLKIMITVLLSRQINSENVRSFGLAFHSLICCYRDFYVRMVEELISSQTEPELVQRLSKAFNDLTAGLNLGYDRQEINTFENNFERFVVHVQGFLFIK